MEGYNSIFSVFFSRPDSKRAFFNLPVHKSGGTSWAAAAISAVGPPETQEEAELTETHKLALFHLLQINIACMQFGFAQS